MERRQKFIALYTIIRTEVHRVFRLWRQTLLPPAITTVLFFVIFGRVIGPRVGVMGGFSYIQFIAPGLIMLQIITSAYSGAVSSFFHAKFNRSIEELLVSPMSHMMILLGYMTGGVLRGILVGVIVTGIALFFTHLHLYSFGVIVLSTLLSCCIFSIAGIINAVFARTYDDISIIPTFVLTPLTYLGGVFYSINLLPPFWKSISHVNPILYIVNTFRYGFLKLTDSHLLYSFGIMFLLLIVLFVWAIRIFQRGAGLRY